MTEQTITVSGFSKTFSITGWRIGYSVAAKKWAGMIGYMSDLVYVCAPAPLQYGVARGLSSLKPEYYDGIRRGLRDKREKICTALAKAGLVPRVPQGAYYVLADISRIPGRTSKDRAMRLLREKGIACVPGEAFFRNPGDGAHLGRFCFAIPDAELDTACRRIETL
jgi:aminotransferase